MSNLFAQSWQFKKERTDCGEVGMDQMLEKGAFLRYEWEFSKTIEKISFVENRPLQFL